MAKKKTKSGRSAATRNSPALSALAKRVRVLETDFSEMRGDVSNVLEDVSELKRTIEQVDKRSQRGETVMLAMQGDIRYLAKSIDRVADALQVGRGSPAELAQSAEMRAAEEAERLADEPDTDEEDTTT